MRRRKMIKKWNDNKVAIEKKIKEDKKNATILKYKEVNLFFTYEIYA